MGKLLKQQELPPGFDERYWEISNQLFDEPCWLMGEGDWDAAREKVRQIWTGLERKYARRTSKPMEQAVLNALSYEARAAMHSVHSVAWHLMLEQLLAENRISQATFVFLKTWHCDWIRVDESRTLFHGHLFGLHPATGLFMSTQTGPELLGQWLVNHASQEHFERFLHGMAVAATFYKQQLDSERAARRGDGQRSQKDLTVASEDLSERRCVQARRPAVHAESTFYRRDDEHRVVVYVPHRIDTAGDSTSVDRCALMQSAMRNLGYQWHIDGVYDDSDQVASPSRSTTVRRMYDDLRRPGFADHLVLVDFKDRLSQVGTGGRVGTLEELGIAVREVDQFLRAQASTARD